MKTRRVTVTLELDTRADLRDLRRAAWWDAWLSSAKDEDGRVIEVVQAEANVIR